MSFHCDKLCSGGCCALLISRIIAAKLRDEGIDVDGNAVYRRRLLIERGHDAARLETSAAKCAVVDAAIDDPARLVELISLAGAARGSKLKIVQSGFRIQVCEWSNGLVCVNDTSKDQAREKLLAIMRTPADPSSREACEKILRGES